MVNDSDPNGGVLAARWVRVAERAPGIAVRQWIVRTVLALVAIFGVLNLVALTRWGWKSGNKQSLITNS